MQGIIDNVAPIIGALALVFAIYWNWGRQLIRKHQLKHPARVHFTIRNSKQSLSGRDVSDGDPHLVRELVLPSNSNVPIEIGYYPRVAFKPNRLVFGCTGPKAERPFALEYFDQYSKRGQKTRRVPGKDPGHTLDIANYYHYDISKPYNVGSHYVIGFKLRTRRAGVYPVIVSFLTDEVEGNARLTIRVEDRPRTPMLCHARNHGLNCLVRPIKKRKRRARR